MSKWHTQTQPQLHTDILKRFTHTQPHTETAFMDSVSTAYLFCCEKRACSVVSRLCPKRATSQVIFLFVGVQYFRVCVSVPPLLLLLHLLLTLTPLLPFAIPPGLALQCVSL